MTGRTRTGVVTAAVLLYVVVAHDRASEGRAGPPQQAQPAAVQTSAPPAAAPQRAPVSPQRALLDQYCVGCHNDRVRSGGLALTDLNLDAVDQHAEVAEKVIRKLRGGLMPPAGAKRPDRQASAEFVSWLETRIDAAVSDPRAGR